MAAIDSGVSVEKKRKLGRVGDGDQPDSSSDEITSLQNFKLCKVLNENAKHKFLFVHGKFEGSDDDAVVLLEKTAFPTDAKNMDLLWSKTTLNETLKNDIYGTYDAFPPPMLNGEYYPCSMFADTLQ
jgi:hypothetical protein